MVMMMSLVLYWTVLSTDTTTVVELGILGVGKKER